MGENCRHVFLVGLPRTGTTLTSAILNGSNDIGISMYESHFLVGNRAPDDTHHPSFCSKLKEIGDISTDAGVEAIVDFIYDQPEPFWRHVVSQLDREEFQRQLMQSDRTERALFDLAMRINAVGKRICGEKTPAHIFHVHTLLHWFPDAKVVHIVRDPRAAYVSQLKKLEAKNRARSVLASRRFRLLHELYQSTGFIRGWRRILRLHLEYQALYPDRYRLMRFEDLVTDPRATLQALCRFLDVEFSETMVTNQVNINSSFPAARQTLGFDKQAIDRWKEHMHPLIRQWFSIWCSKSAGQYGYLLS